MNLRTPAPAIAKFLLAACTVPACFLPAHCQSAQVPAARPPFSQSGAQSAALQAASAAFREGYAAAQRDDLPAARTSFEKAVRIAPKIAAAHAALGTTLLALGDFSRAVHELETARSLDPSDQLTLLNLCVAYSDSRNYPASAAVFRHFQQTASARGTVSPRALTPDVAIAIATALSETGDIPAAQDLLEQAVQAAASTSGNAQLPGSAQLHDALGIILARQSRFPEAETHLRQAIAIDDTLAAAHFHLGSVELATNRPQDAVPEFTRALALTPASIPYVVELAKALVLTSHEAQAVDFLRSALAKLTSSASEEATEVRYQLALALQSSGDPRQALPLFDEVLKGRPDDPQALTNAGLARVQTGDAKGAVPLYLRALKLNPNDPTVHEDLGVAYLQQADFDHALEHFRAGIAIDSASAQLHYDLGLALKLKDDLAAAISELEHAASLDPALPDPPYTLGIIFMQQGDFARAAASLETATVLQPRNGDAWAILGSVYQQMQQPDKAVPALRQAIALAPDQPSPHINLGAILAAQGHKEEAAAERKIGANLTRAATNRQKASFNIDSGTLLLNRGQTAEALIQLQTAVEADPGYPAAHLALANALDRAGRKAEAAQERRRAATLLPNP